MRCLMSDSVRCRYCADSVAIRMANPNPYFLRIGLTQNWIRGAFVSSNSSGPGSVPPG